jgi:hypothetical protein
LYRKICRSVTRSETREGAGFLHLQLTTKRHPESL